MSRIWDARVLGGLTQPECTRDARGLAHLQSNLRRLIGASPIRPLRPKRRHAELSRVTEAARRRS